jgi:hypothetical protein
MKSKILAGILVCSLILSIGFAPRSAHASGLPVIDAANLVPNIATKIETGATHIIEAAQLALGNALNVKEFSLDPIAWAVGKMAVQSLTKSVVNWINSGFHGSPAFVTDLEGNLQAVGDAAAGKFLTTLANDPALKSPFQSKVAQVAYTGYLLATAKDTYVRVNAYNLNKVTPNDTQFLAGDFSKGGWSAWFAATMNPQNNPYGAQILAENGLNVNVTAAQNKRTIELNWGQGFMSWCGDSGGHTDSTTSGASGSIPAEELKALKTIDPSYCAKEDGSLGTIKTPGSVIQAQVNKTLGLQGDQLVTADEFNEIIGALLSQLVSQALGSGGLSGVSSTSSGGTGYLDQATGSGASSNVTASISKATTDQIEKVKVFQANWQKIKNEADLAKTKVESCTSSDKVADVTRVLEQAAVGLGSASASLTKLQQVLTDATAAGSDATKLAQVGQELTDALQSPAATDMAFAESQSQDAPADSGATLYSQMKDIAEGTCSIIH